jgi:hypothetical protein
MLPQSEAGILERLEHPEGLVEVEHDRARYGSSVGSRWLTTEVCATGVTFMDTEGIASRPTERQFRAADAW